MKNPIVVGNIEVGSARDLIMNNGTGTLVESEDCCRLFLCEHAGRTGSCPVGIVLPDFLCRQFPIVEADPAKDARPTIVCKGRVADYHLSGKITASDAEV